VGLHGVILMASPLHVLVLLIQMFIMDQEDEEQVLLQVVLQEQVEVLPLTLQET